ncbi:MAG TPA: cupin domain-containing protein [Anaerolineales bacterium]|nr:cupin domain-containing protein [Anaerolineales bacterium]
MRFVREQDVVGDRLEAPHARHVKHLAAPWTMGTSKIWLGISVIEPGSSSNPHAHDQQEEVFYCLSGGGSILVGEDRLVLEPGTCVFIPQGEMHQLINDRKDEVLRVLSASSPPFDRGGWERVHAGEGE